MNPPIDWLGPTPWETIARAYDEQCPEGFPAELPAGDPSTEIAIAAINQGIDSRLEAVTFTPQGSPEWRSAGPFRKLHMIFDRHGLLVFLRRLYEYDYGESVDEYDQARGDAACGLRGDILQSLGIDE
tara:strand:+ start:1621 stop:2004 length:384 start_codon:yes stop_codon:yes gene_type:complete